MLPETVLAARRKPARQLTDRLSQTRLNTLEREALEAPLQAAKPTSECRGELHSGGWVLEQKRLELLNRGSPNLYGALGGSAIFRFGGTAKGMAEELTLPEEPRGNDGAVGFQPRKNDLTLEQTPYVRTRLTLAVDDVMVGELQQGGFGTDFGEFFRAKSGKNWAVVEVAGGRHKASNLH